MVISRRALLLAGAVFPVSAYAQCVTDAPEAASTNLFLNSGDASNASWGKLGSPTPPTVTGNNAVAPDGTTTAARIDMPAVSGAGNYCMINDPTPVASAGATYTASFFFRGAIGGEKVTIATTNDSVNFLNVVCTLTTGWQRFTLTTALAPGNWYYEYGVDLRIAGSTGTSAQTFYVWGAQVELGAFATSYIPTTSAPVARPLGPLIMSPTQKCNRVTM